MFNVMNFMFEVNRFQVNPNITLFYVPSCLKKGSYLSCYVVCGMNSATAYPEHIMPKKGAKLHFKTVYGGYVGSPTRVKAISKFQRY